MKPRESGVMNLALHVLTTMGCREERGCQNEYQALDSVETGDTLQRDYDLETSIGPKAYDLLLKKDDRETSSLYDRQTRPC